MRIKKHLVRWAALLAVFLVFACSGCSFSGSANKSKSTVVDVSGGGTLKDKFTSAPHKKADGSKFRIAYVDIDPYDVTGSMLYYVIENLKKEGWITYDSLPMSADKVDAGKLVEWLSEQNLGPYIQFVGNANYYLSFQGEDAVAESLRDHVNNKKDIDLIFAMGTWPGQFVKKLNLNVPTMVYGSLNPVSSGIIESSSNSGNKNLWAQTDTAAFTRQIEFYYNTIHFKNVGMVYNDEVVDAIPDYEMAAKKDGFSITKIKIDKLKSDNKADREVYYSNLAKIYEDLVKNKKIDAYLINTDIITDDSEISGLFKIFTEAKIPVFVQIGDNYVKYGAFMEVAPRDYKGLGSFVAYTIGAVLDGAEPEKLTQDYVSSPYLSINLDVAKKISFTPTFEMLMSSENIYAGGRAN